ncbi:hypothetical protein AGMMS4957_05030 [Bacteroidia bacterium]|nr:hypothetical protein AGMMS4957_05030 [Bacteroidia bacterium]
MLEETIPPELSVNPGVIAATAAAYTHSVAVTSNATWTASIDGGADWLELENTSAKGNGEFKIKVKGYDNNNTDVRSAVVSIAVGTLRETVVVSQAPPVPLTVDKETIAATDDDGSYEIKVTSSGPWEVMGANTWCTPSPTFGPAGESTIRINVEKNHYKYDRSAFVNIKSGAFVVQINVTQGSTLLAVDKTTIDALNSTGSYPVTVTSNVSWTAQVTSGDKWCWIFPDSSVGDGDGDGTTITKTIDVHVSEENTTMDERVAIVAITSTSGTSTQVVVVKQAAGDAPSIPPLEVEPQTFTAKAEPASYPIKVTSSGSWEAEVTSGNDWCRISPEYGDGNRTITVYVDEDNPNQDTREATITVTDETGTQKVITVTQGYEIDMRMIEVAGGDIMLNREEVYINGFSIGQYEVTQEQWKNVMGNSNNPSHFKGDNLPVENVSWNDVQVFLTTLNAQTGMNYRLPTVAEWEYAAKGGQYTNNYDYSGSDTIGYVAWYQTNSGRTTHPVGEKDSNELYLFDMTGNVSEWCSDTEANIYRVFRGGSWDDNEMNCTVTSGNSRDPDKGTNTIGFRLVHP